jgi:very-short-patch-repair endonuclease
MDWQYSRLMIPVARDLRKQATPAEKALWELVRSRRCEGWRFVRQEPMGPFALDFYCPAVRLAIEVDGSVHDEPNVARRDADRQAILEQDLNITVLRLTNDEVLLDPQVTVARVVQACSEAQQKLAASPPIAHTRGRRG